MPLTEIRRILNRTSIVLASMSLASACSDATTTTLPPAQMRSHLESNLRYVLNNTDGAAKASNAAEFPLGQLGSVVSNTPAAFKSAANFVATAPTDTTTDWRDDIIKKLNETIFTDANFQGNGIYGLPASLGCPQALDGTLDPKCVERWQTVNLRIRVTGDADMRLTFLVGPSSKEPLSIDIGHQSVSVEVDLGDVSDSLGELAPLLGQQPLNVAMSGKVAAKLTVLGENHVAASLDIVESVSFAGAKQGVDLQSDEAIRFTSAATQLAHVDLDGSREQGSAALDLKRTTLHIPSSGTKPGMDVAVGGASAAATFGKGIAFAITHIGLGDSSTTVDVGGQRGLTLDLNPDSGRHFDVSVTVDALSGIARFVVSPEFDLRLAINHAVLGDAQPVYDVTRIHLFDGTPTLEIQPTASGDDQLKLVSGVLTVDTSPSAYGVYVSAGQCLLSTSEIVDSQAIRRLSAGTCAQ